MRVVCTRSDLGMLVNMRWNMMPARNRLRRFFYLQHLYGFDIAAIGADEGPQFRDQSGPWRHMIKRHRLPAIFAGRCTNLPIHF